MGKCCCAGKRGVKANFLWIIRQSIEASSTLVYWRALITALEGIIYCTFCFAVGWGAAQIVGIYGHKEIATDVLIRVGMVAGGLVVFYQLIMCIKWYLKARTGRDLDLHFALQIMEKSSSLDLCHLENAGNDELLRKRSGMSYASCGIMDSLYTLVCIATMLIGLLALCIHLGLPALGLAGFLVIAEVGRSFLQSKMSKNHESTWRDGFGKLHYFKHLLTDKGPSKEVRLFGLKNFFLPQYIETHGRLHKVRFWKLSGAVNVVIDLIDYAAIGGFVFWLIMGLISKDLSIATFVMTVTAIILAFEVSERLSQLYSAVNRSQKGLDDYRNFLEMEPTITSDSSLPSVPESFGEGICFDNVSLNYPGGDDPALQNINLTIKPGSRIALVGENGSGKTTFVKLLTRLYDPTEGTVHINGDDLRTFNLDSYRSRFGVIFQNFVRYHGTVLENVAYAQPERVNDHDAIKKAIETSGASAVVDRLTDGIDTKIGGWYEKGTDLSDGQWQKIALARAFFRDADVLVLDEPTSVLDARAEYEIFQKFLELTEGKTTVMVSHRFSTVRMADLIYVFDAGKIVEHGSHSELMQKDGLYAELFNMQAEGYRLEN